MPPLSASTRSFRSLAGFGRRIEFWIIGQMLKEGLDVYVPLVDDMGIDAVVRKPDGSFVEVQIKARSKDAVPGHAALFAAIPHELRLNYKDADVSLDLQELFDCVYADGRYDTTDYARPCDPPLEGEDAAWADELLRAAGRR